MICLAPQNSRRAAVERAARETATKRDRIERQLQLRAMPYLALGADSGELLP